MKVEQKLSYSSHGEFLPEPTKKTLADVAKRLQSCNCKFLVVGAFPVQYYGRPRTSWDVDILLISNVSKSRLFNILGNRYKLNYEGKNLIKFIDSQTRAGLDVLLSPRSLGLTNVSLKRVKKVSFNDITISIPSPEDYIISKLKTRRPSTYDYQDIISVLIALYEELNWKYLMERAKEENVLHLLKYYRDSIAWKFR